MIDLVSFEISRGSPTTLKGYSALADRMEFECSQYKCRGPRRASITMLTFDHRSHLRRRIVYSGCWAMIVTVLSVATCPSTRKGFHLYAEITPPIHAELAWRLQFLLGDDCRRVSLNRARWRAGFSGWNKLFERANMKLRRIYNCEPNGQNVKACR